MSISHVNTIANRLSLRKPQRDSLEILDTVCEIAPLAKGAGLSAKLESIRAEFPHVDSFDRDFPSLCFALATGVGKTRLMGAFISYLNMAHGLKDFFIIAPNLTIYQKLIADFTPNTPKYVFKGLGDFALSPPRIITGETYEVMGGRRMVYEQDVHINIFNISKFTARDNKDSKLAKDDARRNMPRIRRLSEFLGESYFEYLAGLDDLVVLMDESHRYRADAGMSAINELKPLLGLELTATPQEENGSRKPVRFGNIIYEYPLSAAIADGFVKEPAVATRQNFHAGDYGEDDLEHIKLRDGISLHEKTKVELEVYCRNNEAPRVKPFILVVARDTLHANTLQELMESDAFCDGRYKGRIITVHSKSTKKCGGEGDEIIQQLLTVESPDNPVEVVIHVNMLKEGWDVTNLYTIVPLRKADSKTLVEQSIGRGLRLPFGRKTGVPSVDGLTIVAHDRFQEIIDAAKDNKSIIMRQVFMEREVPEGGKKAVILPTGIESALLGTRPQQSDGTTRTTMEMPPEVVPAAKPAFATEGEQAAVRTTLAVLGEYETRRSSAELLKPEVIRDIVRKVEARLPPEQEVLMEHAAMRAIQSVVEQTARAFCELTIDIPDIIVAPKGTARCYYQPFDLDLSSVTMQPVAETILVQFLKDQRLRYTVQADTAFMKEKRLEDYIVRGLIDYSDVDYDSNSETLYRLAGEVVAHLRGYLGDEEKVLNVLQYHQGPLCALVHAQLKANFVHEADGYEAYVARGFRTLRETTVAFVGSPRISDFRQPIPAGQRRMIPSMLFGEFRKSLRPVQRFQSYPELIFAKVLENDDAVIKWLKPGANDFKIRYGSGLNYDPDFVVETNEVRYICEPKRADLISDPEVREKARAALAWCGHATEHTRTTDGKPWQYLLIPDDRIQENMNLAGFVASCRLLQG